MKPRPREPLANGRVTSRRAMLGSGLGAVVAVLMVTGILTALPVAQAQPAAGDAIVAGELRIEPTLDNIGVVWFVDGDADLDSSMTIEFRRSGESAWRPGAPAMRAEPSVIVDGSPLGINSWAASAMFLQRGTSYEIRARISDPDGGGTTRVAQATTRTLLQPGPRLRFVEPGSSGGSGTQGNPFRGLQTAADNASPGDTFVIRGGAYESFVLRASGTRSAPITFRSVNGATVIVDGAGTSRGVVTLESTNNIIISGLTIRNGGWGIDAQHTQELLITNNVITDVDFGIYNRRDAGVERYQVICDNVIEGRTPWPASGIPGERGIDLRGWGHTVCNNRVSDFGDCISVQPLTSSSFGNDVFGNDSNRCVDDGIEIDYNQANARVYRNRVTNARTGVSVQPIAGGPAYIFRNELVNLETSTIKLNNGPSGLFIAHNSGFKVGNALQDGAVFNNTVLRNNFFVGTRYAFEFTTASPSDSRDFDYNAWGSLRSDNWFKWGNVRFARIADLPAGVEDHGVQARLDAVVSANMPSSWNVEVAAGSQDLRPAGGSVLINAGTVISNINEPFVTDGRPDAGAFEAGDPRPGYGPGTPRIVPPTGPPAPTPTPVPATPNPVPTPTAVPPTAVPTPLPTVPPGVAVCNSRAVTIDMNTNGGDGMGTAGDDVILGTPGVDVIDSGAGNDTICAGGGDDMVTTGPGNDWARVGTGNDTVNGGPGNDRLFGTSGDDTISGGDGDDTIHGNLGSDTLYGDGGDDKIFGYADNDIIFGGPGHDRLHGNFGEDVIHGQAGNDVLIGYGDDDVLHGGDGNDRLHGNFGDDQLNGNGGNDAIFGYGDDDLVNGGLGDDVIIGNQGNDTLNGNQDNDEIWGGDGNDRVNGGDGADRLFGNSLDDIIIGGPGNDVIDGGPGIDTCTGGPDTDTTTRCEPNNQ